LVYCEPRRGYLPRAWFPVLWSFIGLVSAVDSYFVVRFRDLLPELEENPVGRYLIELQNGRVDVLLRAKAAGTITVLGILAGLYIYRHRWTGLIAGSIASFQIALLLYMTMSLPDCSAPANSLSQFLNECAVAAGAAGKIAARPDLLGSGPFQRDRSAAFDSDTL